MKHARIMRLDGGWLIRARCTCNPAIPHDTSLAWHGDIDEALKRFRRQRRSTWSYPFPVHSYVIW